MYNGHPWDSKKWPLFRGGRYLEGSHQKISINFGLMGFRPVVVDRWPLFRGGCKNRFDCTVKELIHFFFLWSVIFRISRHWETFNKKNASEICVKSTACYCLALQRTWTKVSWFRLNHACTLTLFKLSAEYDLTT